jgi:hypothetical protein
MSELPGYAIACVCSEIQVNYCIGICSYNKINFQTGLTQ